MKTPNLFVAATVAATLLCAGCYATPGTPEVEGGGLGIRYLPVPGHPHGSLIRPHGCDHEPNPRSQYGDSE